MDDLGPNMRRLADSDAARSLVARVIAGPGDLETWDVAVRLDDGEVPLEASGRGPDVEAAAAELLRVISLRAPQLLKQQEVGAEE